MLDSYDQEVLLRINEYISVNKTLSKITHLFMLLQIALAIAKE